MIGLLIYPVDRRMTRALLIALFAINTTGVNVSFADPIGRFTLDAGATDYQTFQRKSDKAADLTLAGTAREPGAAVVVRLVDQLTGEVIEDLDWHEIGRPNAAGKWQGTLRSVPVGGEYRLQLKLVNETGGSLSAFPDVEHLLVGDLWVTAGQSNMIGRGSLGPDREKGIPQVHVFNCDYRWYQAEEPMTGKVTDRLILGGNWERDSGSHSLCLRFAKDLYAATGVPIGIVPTAIGGTALSHWAKPAGPHPSGAISLYERTLKMVQGAGGRVTGMIWWQGEGEAGTDTQEYLVPFKRLIADFRSDLGDSQLPFLFVQLQSTDAEPEDPTRDQRWTNKLESQRLAEQQIPHTAMVVTIDQPRIDVHHLDTPGLKIVGSRFALAARALVYGQDVAWSGPRLKHAAFTDESRLKVLVRFSGLDRELRPATVIKGFQVIGPDGLIPIESAERDRKDPAAVLLSLSRSASEDARVRYGFGRNPEVNLADAVGLPAAVFAAQPIR